MGNPKAVVIILLIVPYRNLNSLALRIFVAEVAFNRTIQEFKRGLPRENGLPEMCF